MPFFFFFFFLHFDISHFKWHWSPESPNSNSTLTVAVAVPVFSCATIGGRTLCPSRGRLEGRSGHPSGWTRRTQGCKNKNRKQEYKSRGIWGKHSDEVQPELPTKNRHNSNRCITENTSKLYSVVIELHIKVKIIPISSQKEVALWGKYRCTAY